MRCDQVMSANAEWVSPETNIQEAARLMAFHGLGLLPVCDSAGFALGVLTDRDIVLRVALADLSARDTQVGEVMSAPVVFVPPDAPLSRAEELLAEQGLSRLLVFDDDGRLLGVLSLADILAHDGRRALRTARKVLARETPDRTQGHPHRATPADPQFFHGARNLTPPPEAAWTRPDLATSVIRGSSTGMKEFG